MNHYYKSFRDYARSDTRNRLDRLKKHAQTKTFYLKRTVTSTAFTCENHPVMLDCGHIILLHQEPSETVEFCPVSTCKKAIEKTLDLRNVAKYFEDEESSQNLESMRSRLNELRTEVNVLKRKRDEMTSNVCENLFRNKIRLVCIKQTILIEQIAKTMDNVFDAVLEFDPQIRLLENYNRQMSKSETDYNLLYFVPDFNVCKKCKGELFFVAESNQYLCMICLN